ncbi:alpha/beta hydrolase [Fodinicola acaciae]|uniref:alpha/beta hydrolase n=1 Tax=Fodinicola acaciae TaxID=2681555 RepID=UPI0013D85F2E|nr:alpha/beta hydrolase [Fodinicola acaciae]
MSYDPELVPFLATIPKIQFDDIAAERERRGRLPKPPLNRPAGLDVEDIAADVPVRVYTPSGRDSLPGLLYFHGGGFVTGSLDTVDATAVRIAAGADVVVVSVDYRLAPEHPYPAAVDDGYAALEWTVKNASRLRIDPARLGIGGDSAGGTVAAAVALLVRDRGGASLRFQYLNVPTVDDRSSTPSRLTLVDTPQLDRAGIEAVWRHYLGPRTADAYAAPMRADDLTGLPPAHVVVCEFDPLRDEGIAYAQRLVQSGVPTELHLYPGTFHGSTAFDSAVSRRMIADQTAAVRRLAH